jgi:signal transduction histidine kinase
MTAPKLGNSSMASSLSSEPEAGLERLVRAALEGDAREGITSLLKEIARITNSFGCVLWRATQGAVPPNMGELTMLAGWFDAENSYFGINRVEFKGTVTGRAAIEGWALENDLTGSGNPYRQTPFFVKHEVNKAAACRFEFLRERLGVLMIYRRKNAAEFRKEQEIRLLQRISEVLPYLYSGARQKASYALLKEVGATMQNVRRTSTAGQVTPKKERKAILQEVVAALAATFHSIETSVFIEDEKQKGQFVCACTSKGPHAATIRKTSYEATLDGGFSPLCLFVKEPIRVHDTQDPKRELEEWRKRFPKFRGPLTPSLSAVVNARLGNPTPPPPHSLMVAPIVSEGNPLGFLRCWVALSGPSYFSSDDLELLQLVADYLSQILGAWRRERLDLERRTRDHQAITTLAQAGYTTGKKGREQDVFIAALRVVSQVVPEATVNTIRLRRSDPDRLDYYAYAAPLRSEPPPEEASARRWESAQLPGHSLADQVVEEKQTKCFRGRQLKAHVADSSAEAGEMIIAPIVVNGRVEGTLDLRSESQVRFSRQARFLAESVSTLLALHIATQATEGEQQRATVAKFEAELRASQERAASEKAMRDAFEDVAHQIKSPLAEAARRVEEAAKRFQHGGVGQEFEAVGTLLRRAEFTAKLIGLFASLSKGAQLSLKGTPHTPVDLLRMARQVCENQRPRISPQRNIRIQCDADSFLKHAPTELPADADLLLQALSNLVDNAVKYSYRNSAITVFGARLRQGGFFMGVTNKGIPISPHEVHLIKQRNWRGEAAKSFVGEGTGLGLWIVDHIMRAHGGELQVLPTRPGDGITELRLAFPLAK